MDKLKKKEEQEEKGGDGEEDDEPEKKEEPEAKEGEEKQEEVVGNFDLLDLGEGSKPEDNTANDPQDLPKEEEEKTEEVQPPVKKFGGLAAPPKN